MCQSQQQAEGNKENEAQHPETKKKLHMTDPQANARRILFDTQESEDQGVPMEDLSQDAGFEQMHRAAESASMPARKGPNKRSAEAQTVGQSPPKRARFPDSLHGGQDPTSSGSGILKERHSQSPQTQAYGIVNERAKKLMSSVPKETQTRQPWSTEEIDALTNSIRNHGVSYARIKALDMKSDNKLVKRDQVALKDKARNMKMDYLKYVVWNAFSRFILADSIS